MKNFQLSKVAICICVMLWSACSVKKDGRVAATKLDSQLKVLCYNIHHANPPSKPDFIDLDAIARVITESGADIVALQEVDKNTKRSGNVDQAKVLAERTGLNYQFFKAIDYNGGEYGLAILSRFPLTAIKSYALPQKIKAENRILAQATVQIGDQQVIIANTHLDATGNPANRTAQMQHIVATYQDTKTPIIIAGDLNAVAQTDAIKLLDQHFKRTCVEGCLGTIPQDNPKRTIDYIATKNTSWKLLQHTVIEETYASDHRPLTAKFKIN